MLGQGEGYGGGHEAHLRAGSPHDRLDGIPLRGQQGSSATAGQPDWLEARRCAQARQRGCSGMAALGDDSLLEGGVCCSVLIVEGVGVKTATVWS